MSLIDNVWKRIIICLIFSGAIAKGIAQVTNWKVRISSLLIGVLLYFILNNINRKNQREKAEGENNS